MNATRASRALGLVQISAALLVTACGGGGGSEEQPVPVAPVAEISSQLLDASSSAVASYAADIDDSGRVVTVFTQSDGTRSVLKATLVTPPTAGGNPSAAPAEVLDAAANYNGTGPFSVAMSGGGNAVAMWEATAACTASSYKTDGNCRYVYAARRLVGGSWEAPVLIGDAPAEVTNVVINNAGDIMVAWPSWMRAGSSVSVVTAVAWRPNGSTSFRQQQFLDAARSTADNGRLTLDSAGNMVLLTPSAISGVTRLVAFRGDQTSGFGGQEVLDSSTSNIALEGMWGGINGQVVAFWRQSDGTSVKRWAAALDTTTGNWSTSLRGLPTVQSMAGRVKAVVTEAGDFIWYDLENCRALRRTGGVWQSESAIAPGACPSSASFTAAISRSGNIVGALSGTASTGTNTGQWMAYNGSTNSMTQPFSEELGSGYLFALPRPIGGLLLLSENGVGALISVNNYEELPSVANASGTEGAQANLWAVYVKLL